MSRRGINNYSESRLRSVLKALSWRLFATITTVTIVFIFTGRFVLSLEVGGVEIMTKLILYYIHERIWSAVPVGGKSCT